MVAQSAPQAQTLDLRQQDPDAPRDLGEGFEMKVRGEGDGLVRLIKFPSNRYLTGSADSMTPFKEGVEKALVKVFGCAAFKDCIPTFKAGIGGEVLVLVGERLYEMGPLYFTSDEEGPIIGIVLVPLPRA